MQAVCVALIAGLLSGCAELGYYAQAARGQMSLLADAKPIERWLSDPEVKDDLKARLKRVREIREFAARELGLPDNDSYKHFVRLERPFVMWNVVATPELSLQPERWCFPVAGCVDYRGYYDQQAAQAFARELRGKGLDVRVSGVPAYSTLGWFNDPVLSTFIHYPEAELARLVFHELAHQLAYAPGDSQFNESFATAVEEVGVERWLAQRGDDEVRASYQSFRQRREDFLMLLDGYRVQLEALYRSDRSDTEKRLEKTRLMTRMQTDYTQIKASWGGYAGYDRWFSEPMSNAHFALISTYHDLVPAFRALLKEKQHLPDFYQAVRSLARADKAQRRLMLERYLFMVQHTHSDVADTAFASQ